MKIWITFLVFMTSALYSNMEQLIYEIRDPHTKPARFRNCLEKIGEYMALHLVNDLQTKEVGIHTLAGGTATHKLCNETPVLVTILRAGLPLNRGVQKVFPEAEVGFIAMARNEETLKADVSYCALPAIKDKTVIIVDTMLATGGSCLDAIRIVGARHPKKMIILAAIAAEGGIARIHESYPEIPIHAAAIDPTLNEKGYIVPGLGDAGDRSFGKKEENQSTR